MTLKELFKKVETYNEVAELMRTDKAKIYFCERWGGEHFSKFADFRKYVRREYIKDLADEILTSDGWDFDKPVTIGTNSTEFTAELVA